jgi:hypothetical protein
LTSPRDGSLEMKNRGRRSLSIVSLKVGGIRLQCDLMGHMRVRPRNSVECNLYLVKSQEESLLSVLFTVLIIITA